MLAKVNKFLTDFYDRNLLERLVIYGFLSGFLVKFIFEFIMGQWSFVQSQNKQWFFFGFMALDYIISWRKTLNIKVTANPMSAVALMFFVMVAHGLFMGIMNRNPLFEIVNDTIPLLMIGLNILRMQSASETTRPVDMDFLIKTVAVLAGGACIFGGLAEAMGNPSKPSVGSSQVYFPLMLAVLFMRRPLPRWILFFFAITMIAILDDMNRTTLAFMMASGGIYVLIRSVKAPLQGAAFALAILVAGTVAWTALPEDSQTYKRITGLTKIDLDARTGSVGERQAEWDAIQKRLEGMGETVEMLGLGFGGLYDVQFTHQFNKDYGHAHYAWAWFNLRFGRSGYIYMTLMIAALIFNGLRSARRQDETGMFIAHLCLLGLIYCATHVNSVFLLSGMHFFYSPARHQQRDLFGQPASGPQKNIESLT